MLKEKQTDMSQDNNEKNKSFVGGAIILGIAGLLIKILGAAFRIPLGNIIGDDGMGYYQTAYPIYNLFLVIATAGIPTAISRMVSERIALDKHWEAHRVFTTSFKLLLGIGVVLSSAMLFGSQCIADLVKEPGAVWCMRATAPALLFCPLMASFRGYFQGRQNMSPTASSQVIEQVFRVAIGLTLAILLVPKGLNFAAAGANFGASAGGIFGCIGIVLIYMKYKPSIDKELAGCEKTYEQSQKSILRDILIIAVPITIGAAVMPIINTIDTVIVKSRLISIGYDSDIARGLYGQLTGMAGPLINFPQVLTQAVSMSLVPVIASAYKRKEMDFMRSNIALGLRYALIISTPCAFGMMFLSRPIMLLLYPMQRESALSAAGCLAIYSVGVIFLASLQTLTGILQGIGKQFIPVKNLCIGSGVKIVLTYILTGIPAINVQGAAIGTVAAYLTAALLNLRAVKKYTDAGIDVNLTLVKPVISSLVMGAMALAAQKLLYLVLGNAVSTVAGVGVGVVVYLFMILKTGTLSVEELSGMPKGKKIVSLLRKMNLVK